MRAVELFCGAGGMSLGLQRAGVDMIQAYDAWSPAVETALPSCLTLAFPISILHEITELISPIEGFSLPA